MSKFKVGDKVRRVRSPLWFAPIGFESTVSAYGEFLLFTGLNGETFSLWEEHWELIGPVRTVTTTSKVVEPGVYGRVVVAAHDDDDVFVGIAGNALGERVVYRLTASELRAAAETFTQLADALESAP